MASARNSEGIPSGATSWPPRTTDHAERRDTIDEKSLDADLEREAEGSGVATVPQIDAALERRVVRKFDLNLVPIVMALCEVPFLAFKVVKLG